MDFKFYGISINPSCADMTKAKFLKMMSAYIDKGIVSSDQAEEVYNEIKKSKKSEGE